MFCYSHLVICLTHAGDFMPQKYAIENKYCLRGPSCNVIVCLCFIYTSLFGWEGPWFGGLTEGLIKYYDFIIRVKQE